MIAVVVLVVVVGGGLGGYFAFSHTSTALACNGTASSSQCSSVGSFGSPTSTTFSPTSSSTTPSSTPSSSTSSSIPTTSSSVPPTTPPSPPTTGSGPAPPPATGQTIAAGDGINLTLAQGWSIGSSGSPVELKHTSPAAGFLIQVLQTTATTASAFGQQFLSQTLSQAVSNLQVNDQGTTNLTWKTFSQVNIYTINGSVTTTQGSQPVSGQVFALLNPQTHLGAEIYAASDTSADYTSVNQSVLTMVNSLAD